MGGSKSPARATKEAMPRSNTNAMNVATLSPELALVDPDLAAIARAMLPAPPDCLAARVMALPQPASRPPPEIASQPPLTPHDPWLPTPASRRRRPSLGALAGTLFATLVIVSPALDLIPWIGAAPPTLVGPERPADPASPRIVKAKPAATAKPATRSSDPPSQPSRQDPSKQAGSGAAKTTGSKAKAKSGRSATPAAGRASKPKRAPRPAGAAAGSVTRQVSRGVRLRWKPAKGADLYNVIFWGDGKRVKDLWVKASSVVVGRSSSGNRRAALPAGRYTWFVFPGYRRGDKVEYGKLVGSGSLIVAP
jgi:hypothetical protein